MQFMVTRVSPLMVLLLQNVLSCQDRMWSRYLLHPWSDRAPLPSPSTILGSTLAFHDDTLWKTAVKGKRSPIGWSCLRLRHSEWSTQHLRLAAWQHFILANVLIQGQCEEQKMSTRRKSFLWVNVFLSIFKSQTTSPL